MLSFDSIATARNAIAARAISAEELVRQSLGRIDALDARFRAFLSVYPELALARAKDVDAGRVTGALAGVPIAIKDNLCTTFGTTTCASRMLKDFKSPYEATVVRKLEAAGAVIVGKTNLDEFAMGSSTENSAFGPTKNPWDETRVPGGSSGGSAAALAAGMCCGAIGSDTGGSVRQPAGLCGLVGLKPTYGRVSRYGLVAYASSLDQIGPFGWTVEDVAVLLNVIAGHDPHDSTSAPDAVPDYTADLDVPLEGLKLGIVREYRRTEGMDPQVQAAVEKAEQKYEELGADLIEVSLPHTEYGIAAYYVIAPSEASSNLARYDGVHFGHRTKDAVRDIVELFSKSRSEGFGDEVQRRIMIGTYALSEGYGKGYYLRALQVRRKIKEDFDRAFAQCDAVICPTSPTPAFRIGERTDDPLHMYMADVFTVTANIAGVPAVSLPCGFTSGETPLPVGVQLLGPTFSEAKLLRIARTYEAATEWHKRRPVIG